MRVALVLLLVAACGDGVGAPDASRPPDADLGLVSVTFHGSVPPAGQQVFFQNADSSLVLATRTGLDGTVNAYMAPGGFVTVVVNRESQVAYTWADVQPGDHLVLREGGLAQQIDPVSVWMRVPEDPGASFYQLSSSCGFASLAGAEIEPTAIELVGCPSNKVGMLVRTFGAADHYLFRDAVSIEQGAMIELAGPYLTPVQTTLHAVHVPPQLLQMSARQALIGSGTELYVDGGFGAAPIVPEDGEATALLTMPLPATGTLVSQIHGTVSSGLGVTEVIEWGPPRAQITLDFGATPLRAYTELPQYIRTQHAIRWNEQPTGAVADAVLTGFSWFRPETGESYQWQILAPRTAEPVVRLPLLPPREFLPTDRDSLSLPFLLANLAADGGYARLRPLVLGNWGLGQAWPTDGPSGHVVVESLPQ